MFQMGDQIHQTCGIMFDNSSLNPFASRSQLYLCNIFFATYLCNILFPPIFSFFSPPPDFYSIVIVMGWQSRDFFKCLPPLFKSCTSATILPVSEKVSTNQIDRLSGPWISIPEDSSPLIKYPNKQKNLFIVFF